MRHSIINGQRKLRLSKILIATTFMLAVSACSTTSDKGPLANMDLPKLELKMNEAEQLKQAGKTEDALKMLDELARANPTQSAPWKQKARMHFDALQYGSAAVAAEEALARDPDDRNIKSILAISGLRIATRALAELRSGETNAGDVRKDAELLAEMLRKAVGEDILVPVPNKPMLPAPLVQRSFKAKPKSDTRSTPPANKAETTTKSSPKAAEPAAGDGDPFSSLR